MERNLKWTTRESKQLLKDKWIDVRADSCVRPDGVVVEPFYVYGFPDYTCAVAITKDGKIILEKIYRHGLDVIATELPGGCVDKADADAKETIARELLEETGYRFDKIEFLGNTSPNPTTNTNLMHMFLATGGEFDASQELDKDEDVEVILVSMDEFVKLFKENQFIQSMHMTGIFLALQKLGKITVQ
ncbi:ADP-ribose pyrophosphatase [mine drainage metagenome]|uniref:ADP-ribose pyrophosphatase n=1 Tax=mine drainage metagenome TaxID=410659 RepID=A0A1J5RN87_9ZZZZ